MIDLNAGPEADDLEKPAAAGRLRAPFPWFGGKSRAADLIWQRFGNVPNFVEPFAGSLAVLLARPHAPKIETVNDLDCYLANFWRALAADPDGLAAAADWPVNETDLYARHRWLVGQAEFRARMLADPEYYDLRIAGWWVWGLPICIAGRWCLERGYNDGTADDQAPTQSLHLYNGMGVHADRLAGDRLIVEFRRLAARLRRVRVACGDWTYVLKNAATTLYGLTAVLLDPPYSADERASVYATESDIDADVRAWAIANGDDPSFRIALCGYGGDHDMPPNWEAVPWRTPGGWARLSNGRGRDNAAREMVWFSPHCLKPSLQRGLFDDLGAEGGPA